MILNTYVTAAILFSSVTFATAHSYNIQLGIASENFEGNKETYTQLTGTVRYSTDIQGSVIALDYFYKF